MKNLNDKFNLIETKVSRNRIVMPPMDTLMAEDGFANNFHIQHYGARAYGGVGTIIIESTAISSEGRIRPKDLGLWKDEHISKMAEVAQIAKQAGAVIGVQLNHAGAKAETEEVKYAAGIKYFSYLDQSKTKLMDEMDFMRIENQFVSAAQRAKKAGFDFVEIHGAHGYLLSEIMGKSMNEVNTSIDILERSQIVINIARRIKEEVQIPVGIRISFEDYAPEGMKTEDFEPLVKELEKYVSFFHVSSGETLARIKITDLIAENGKIFRLPIADKVKKMTTKPLIVVGNIFTKEDVEKVLSHDIDAAAIGKELLFNPNVTVNSLIDTEIASKEDYHWNNNIWFEPVGYLQIMKKLGNK